MSFYHCTCGNRLSNVGSPNNMEHYMLNDYQMDSLEPNDKCDKIFDLAISVWKCPDCKRLTFFDELNNVTQVYTLEKEVALTE